MTWYSDPDRGYYWIDPLKTHPPSIPHGVVKLRKIAPNELTYPAAYQTETGANFYYLYVVPSPNKLPLSGLRPPSPFPDQPTYELLRTKLLAGENFNNQDADYIELVEGDSVQITNQGRPLLRYFSVSRFPNGIHFCAFQKPIVPKEWYQKYLGKSVTVSTRNGCLGIESKALKWTAIISGLEVDLTTGAKSDWYEASLGKYYLTQRIIQEYLYQITPEYLTQLAKRNTVATKCPGCKIQSIDHLEVHLQRKELTLFLIFAMYEFNGPGGDKMTYDLIDIMRGTNLLQKNNVCQNLRQLATVFFQSLLMDNFILDVPQAVRNGGTLFVWSHRPKREYYTGKYVPLSNKATLTGPVHDSYMDNEEVYLPDE